MDWTYFTWNSRNVKICGLFPGIGLSKTEFILKSRPPRPSALQSGEYTPVTNIAFQMSLTLFYFFTTTNAYKQVVNENTSRKDYVHAVPEKNQKLFE